MNLLLKNLKELSEQHTVFTQDKEKPNKITTVKAIELIEVPSTATPADEKLTETGVEKTIELTEQTIANVPNEAKVIELITKSKTKELRLMLIKRIQKIVNKIKIAIFEI